MTMRAGAVPDCVTCGRPCDDGTVTFRDEAWQTTRVLCFACDTTESYAAYAKDGRLRTSLVSEASLCVWRADHPSDRYRGPAPSDERVALARRVNADAAVVHAAIKRFEAAVWFKGLQPTVQKARTKGMRSTEAIPTPHGPVDLLSWTCAGRAMMTLDAPTIQVTVITAEDEPESRMGMQGVDGPVDQIVDILDCVVAAWARGEVAMREDSKVGVF